LELGLRGRPLAPRHPTVWRLLATNMTSSRQKEDSWRGVYSSKPSWRLGAEHPAHTLHQRLGGGLHLADALAHLVARVGSDSILVRDQQPHCQV
jgi:hypothetical protein